jgi:sulfatase maturation enzyme AslB (radical SAM superfamily)|tara:strand:- start:12539 stop:13681 length:1143 start_codon:yes stop_codon:yes gene_type:complete
MFCFVPFMHSHVDTTATNRVCCAGQWYKKYDLQEWDSKDYQDIRTSLMSDDTEWRRECIECKNKEESGAQSLRQHYNDVYDQFDKPELNIVTGTNFDAPISYDLSMTNLCNLSCRMCGPHSSSQLQKESIKHPELWPEYADDLHKDYNKRYDLDKMLDNAESLFEVKFRGGEPTLQPETRAILERLIEVGNINLNILLTTNGTNANNTFFKLLTQFKNVHIQFSIDAYGKGHDYIRGPASDFKTIWSNVKKIRELNWAGNVDFEINQTVQTLNIFDFWRLRQEVSLQYDWCRFRNFIVYDPHIHSPRFMPDQWKDIAVAKAKEAGAYEDEKHIFNMLNKYNHNNDVMQALRGNIELMDVSRKQHLKDYYPLVNDLFEAHE